MPRHLSTVLVIAGLIASIGVWAMHFRRVDHHTTVSESVSGRTTAALSEVLEAGFDPDTRLDTTRNWDRLTPLTLAAVSGNLEAMRLLLEHGADPMIRDRRGRTPITVVAVSDEAAALALLIEAAGGPETLGEKILATALVEAVGRGADDCVDVLLQTGVDVNARGDQGSIALHVAVTRSASEATFDRILDSGGDPTAKTSAGDTPLTLCLRTLERDSGGNRTSFERRARRLVEAGADVNARSSRNKTCLETAVEFSEPLAEQFIAAGADVNFRGGNGRTPLRQAVRSGTAKMVKMLLEAGAHPDKVDNSTFWSPMTTLAVAEQRAAGGNDEEADAILAMIREALGLPAVREEGDGQAAGATDGT